MGAGISARQTRPGNVIIGSTEEPVGFNKQVTASSVSQFAREILGHFSKLRQLSVIRTWAGLRPTTPDAAPIIELLNEPEGFCLAVGHSRRGVGYGPGTGQLVASLLTGARPFLSLDRFALHRFTRQPATP
jgi:sarcosine oxidase subunit beta